jgi:predicted nucleic acid-binding protein
MLKVVSNTTPLISLLKLNRLEILKALYTEIIIPTAVFREIENGKNKKYYQDLSKYNWIIITAIRNKHSTEYFLDLDEGEAEAIILATEIDADLILLDEKLGRFHANDAGLKVTGTIGVLLKAKNTGIITKIKPLLIELTEKDVWLSNRLIKEICKLSNE